MINLLHTFILQDCAAWVYREAHSFASLNCLSANERESVYAGEKGSLSIILLDSYLK